MPWSATKQFPCPFARINMAEANGKLTESLNWLSYFAIDNVAWIGLSGMVRKVRTVGAACRKFDQVWVVAQLAEVLCDRYRGADRAVRYK